MQKIKNYSSGLFARNFLLLMTLMLCCLGLWFAVFLQTGLDARADEMSKRVASSVNLTRTALHYAQHSDQAELLTDLSRHESLDVHIRLKNDVVEPLPSEQYWQRIETNLHASLGAETVIAWQINQQPGFWVSFTNDKNHYWLAFNRQQINGASPMQWASWIVGALLLSLLGAMIITSYVNRPLTTLARFAKSISSGKITPPLPETGAREIKLVNASFNRMAYALRQTESARDMMFAGLSHDLRTPLTRMRLEIELSPMSEETRELVDADLEQVDHSINKLIEYARASDTAHQNAAPKFTPIINISKELTSFITLERERIERQGGKLEARVSDNLHARIEPFCLQRIISNLFENIRRYGCNERGVPEIFLRLECLGKELTLEIEDTGKGIAQHDAETLLRPFARGNASRTDANATGLGLAIVKRLVTQANGTIRLLSGNQGLVVKIIIPSV